MTARTYIGRLASGSQRNFADTLRAAYGVAPFGSKAAVLRREGLY